MKSKVLLVLLSLLTSAYSIKTKSIEYRESGTELRGYMAMPDNASKLKPLACVLIVHDWDGLNEYEKSRADQLARLGYVAVALDVYGKNVKVTSSQQAGALAGTFKGDRVLFRKRLVAGLAAALSTGIVNPNKVAAIGYCFGGTGVLELARSGANIKGVVSFHGGLDTPNPSDAKQIRSKVMVLHGADDPFVPAQQVDDFQNEMRNAKVDWQLAMFGGAVHAFTEPNAGNNPTSGAAYNKSADKRSWEMMKGFLKEVLGT